MGNFASGSSAHVPLEIENGVGNPPFVQGVKQLGYGGYIHARIPVSPRE